jgi:hypothetical protein
MDLKKWFNSFLLFSILIIVCCGTKDKTQSINISASPRPQRITFSPENSREISSDSLFRAVKVLELDLTKPGDIAMLFELRCTESSIIATVPDYYLVFDKKGSLKSKISTGILKKNSVMTHVYFDVDSNCLTAFYGEKYAQLDFNGKLIYAGSIPYSIAPKNFIPLDDSTWLFYNPHIYSETDTLRLFTSGRDFQIKKEYLKHKKDTPSSGVFFKYLHPTKKGIYITDRVTDTIYLFKNSGLLPAFLFDYHQFIPRRYITMTDLGPQEVFNNFTVVTDNSVLSKVTTVAGTYFVYYNLLNKKAVTINKLSDFIDILNLCQLKGSDNEGNLYWALNNRKVEGLDKSEALKIGLSAEKLKRPEFLEGKIAYIIVTSLK